VARSRSPEKATNARPVVSHGYALLYEYERASELKNLDKVLDGPRRARVSPRKLAGGVRDE
jgi:hypothetical protein